jgi:non-homologous end joining protein Ku
MALIEKKQAGEEIVADEPAEKGGKVVDLMEALRRSLSAAKGSGKESGKTEKAETARHRPPHRARPKRATTKRAKRK